MIAERGLMRSMLTFGVYAAGLLFPGTSCAAAASWQLDDGTTVRLATAEDGRGVLGRTDAFVERMSPFDRSVRLKTDQPVSPRQYLLYAAEQALDWNEEEREKSGRAIEAIRRRLTRWTLPWPEEILLIKTTGAEEADAAYCRQGAIVLPRPKLTGPADRLERLLIHELFHVLSSQNPALRRKLYRVVGFRPCPEIEYPPEVAARRITNPDAPTTDYYVEVHVDGRAVKVVPILFATPERYDAAKGGNLFEYLTFRLMAVEEHGDRWRPVLEDGRAVLWRADDLPSYHDQIGRNTDYIIHPEEVLAENFVHLVEGKTDVPTSRILHEMHRELSNVGEP